MNQRNAVSVVVPVYNEVENVANLHEEINFACASAGYIYEIIFTDDGSTDGTFEKCKTLSPLKIIRLRRNFGQTAAMDAGIKEAQYPIIVTMDGIISFSCFDSSLNIQKYLLLLLV